MRKCKPSFLGLFAVTKSFNIKPDRSGIPSWPMPSAANPSKCQTYFGMKIHIRRKGERDIRTQNVHKRDLSKHLLVQTDKRLSVTGAGTYHRVTKHQLVITAHHHPTQTQKRRDRGWKGREGEEKPYINIQTLQGGSPLPPLKKGQDLNKTLLQYS